MSMQSGCWVAGSRAPEGPSAQGSRLGLPNPSLSLNAHAGAGQGGDSAHTYKVEVKTGDVRGAGTDADVSICVYGTKGDTGACPPAAVASSSSQPAA